MRTRTCKSHRYPQTSFLFGEHDNCPMYDFVGTMGPELLHDVEVEREEADRGRQRRRQHHQARGMGLDPCARVPRVATCRVIKASEWTMCRIGRNIFFCTCIGFKLGDRGRVWRFCFDIC